MEIVALTSFLAPFLPYVVQAGQKVAGKAADVIGEEAANYAEKLWERLRPGVESKPAAKEAVEDVAEEPRGRGRARRASQPAHASCSRRTRRSGPT